MLKKVLLPGWLTCKFFRFWLNPVSLFISYLSEKKLLNEKPSKNEAIHLKKTKQKMGLISPMSTII